jgi:hypothetical protein
MNGPKMSHLRDSTPQQAQKSPEYVPSFLFLNGTLLAAVYLPGTPMHGGRKPTAAEPSGMQL